MLYFRVALGEKSNKVQDQSPKTPINKMETERKVVKRVVRRTEIGIVTNDETEMRTEAKIEGETKIDIETEIEIVIAIGIVI